MPELSEYTPRIVEYLLDHHFDDHVHLFQVEWHADLDFALAWLRQQEDEEHVALAFIAQAWLEGHEEKEVAAHFNVAVEVVREHRVWLCHVLADWLNGCS